MAADFTTGGTLRLVMYSRPGCHLCEVAKEAVAPLLRRYGVILEERNVEDDPAWERSFGNSIPVGVIDSRKVFKFRVDVPALERAIRARLD